MKNNVLDLMVKKCANLRKEESKKINPEDAEVRWWSKGFVDVPGIDIDPEIGEQISDEGEYCFARIPGSEIWLGLGELPRETQRKLWAMRREEIYAAFLKSPLDDGSGLTVGQWLKIRKEEGTRIDAETAEVHVRKVLIFDPYGMGFPVYHEQWFELSKQAFACNPGSATWVWFRDLPEGTLRRLEERRKKEETVRSLSERAVTEERHAPNPLYQSDDPF